MCEYIKTKFPHIYLYTSTNGLALTEEKARRLVHSGIDEVTFSIDGASQDTYVQVPAARRLREGAGQPAGDGRREGRARPRRAAPELALHPLQVERPRRGDERGAAAGRRDRASIACAGRSPITRRTASRAGFVPGTDDFKAIEHEIWDHNNLGNAIPGATPRAQIDVRTLVPGAADPRAARPDAAGRRRASRTCRTGGFAAQASYGRRLVRLGAQLCAADGTLIDRDYARAWLPHHLEGGQQADIAIEIPAPDRAGPLPAEVRPGQRRHRLVRDVGVADDDQGLLVL